MGLNCAVGMHVLIITDLKMEYSKKTGKIQEFLIAVSLTGETGKCFIGYFKITFGFYCKGKEN